MQIKVSPSISKLLKSVSDIPPKWKDIRTCADMNELHEMFDLNQFDIMFSGHPCREKVLRES